MEPEPITLHAWGKEAYLVDYGINRKIMAQAKDVCEESLQLCSDCPACSHGCLSERGNSINCTGGVFVTKETLTIMRLLGAEVKFVRKDPYDRLLP
jgi:hypothetical protein